MCRLYGFRANEETKVECTLVYAQNSLMTQSHQDLAGRSHAHGWGVATYEDHHPRVDRQAWAAYHGEHFRDTAARTYSNTVIAHVRHATVGPAAIENTHPFIHRQWTFAHNGTIPNFDRVKPLLIDAMSPAHRAAMGGVTDSEHLFRYLLSLREAEPRAPLVDILRNGLASVIRWCTEIDRTAKIGLNVLLTNGDELVGSRWGRTLYRLDRLGVYDCEVCGFPHIHHHSGTDYRAIVVASEPITHEDWTEVPERTVYSVSRDLRFHILDLEAAVGAD